MADTLVTAYRWRWLALVAVLAAEIMDLIDGTVVGIAAPSIRAELGGGEAMIQWVAAGYTLAFAAGLITGGRLGDLYGRRRMFLLGLIGFVAASALCGLATSPGMLIGFRVAQGLLGAMLIPQGFGILKATFPPDDLGKAFGAFGPTIGLAVVGAPILGGALIAWDVAGLGWRTIFLINVPLGLAALALAAAVLPESRAEDGPRPDPVGMVLVSTGLTLLVFPLVEGRELGWPAWTFGMLAAGAGLLAVFAAHQVRRSRAGRAPLVEPALFRLRTFTAGMAVGLALFAGITGLALALGLYLQLGLGYTPLQAGLTQAPWALGIAAGSALSGAVLAARLGRTGLQIGAVVAAAGLGGVLLTVTTAGAGDGLGARTLVGRVRLRAGPGHDAVLRHHAGGRHAAAGRLGVRRAEREPAARRHRRGGGAGHGVLRPVRRGPPHRRHGRRAGRVGGAGAGRGGARVPAAPAHGALEAGLGEPALPHGRVADRLDRVGRSAAQQREQEVGHGSADGDVALGVPVLPRDALTGAADEPLPRAPEAVVGGVQVQRGAVGEGVVGGLERPLLQQTEPFGDAVGRTLGGNHEVGPEGERGVGPVHQHLVLAPADPPGRGTAGR